MGFWHTGYVEHHQISSFWVEGQDVSLDIEHLCEQCGKVFQAIDKLIEHRFSIHPYQSTALLIRGREIGALPININTLLDPLDVSIVNTDSVLLNGRQIELKNLAIELSKLHNETISLTLSNAQLSSSYKINFNISSAEDLSGVENAFLELVKGKELTRDSIDKFILKTSDFKSASIYVNGLCQYFYGVLAKEGGESSSLSPIKYREKFNQSAEQLIDYSTVLSNYIKGLIAFHFNHFSEAKKFLNEGNIFNISSFFEKIFSGNDADLDDYLTIESKFLENILIDEETNLILRTFRNNNPTRADLNELCQEISAKKISDFGKLKIKILLIKLFIKCKIEKQAIPILIELKGLSNIESWANQLLIKIEEKR
jgi:hypothetical protein